MCHGQTLILEGVIYQSNSSKGLPYVSVGIKGSAKGTVTDSVGNFSLTATSSDSLMISFVGFKPRTIPIREFKSPVFLEEEVFRLKEVVVNFLVQIGLKSSLVIETEIQLTCQQSLAQKYRINSASRV
jgi:hypothetical protein